MRTRLILLALLATGCTTTPGAQQRPEPPPSTSPPSTSPTAVQPARRADLDRSGPPRLAHVRGHVLNRTDGSRLRIRLGFRGRWGISSLSGPRPVVPESALRKEDKDWKRRGFATDLDDPPYRVPTPSGRTRSPDGRHWWHLRRRSLVIGGPNSEVEIPAPDRG